MRSPGRGSSGQPRVTSVPDALRTGYSTGFFSRSGQMYDVNGRPSINTSTRRAAAFGVTVTWEYVGRTALRSADAADHRPVRPTYTMASATRTITGALLVGL